MKIKNNKILNLFKFELILIVVFYLLFFNEKNVDIKIKNSKIINQKDYLNNQFAIIINNCTSCGLFSFYLTSLACIHKYLLEGYIPIIDIKSFPNVINGFNTKKSNCWEIFFQQPFGYTLEEVLENAKNISKIICYNCEPRLYHRYMPFKNVEIDFWHYFAIKYMPIKTEIINLAEKIMFSLFINSTNILGVLTRGTDYLIIKPKFHGIPPNIFDLIHDVKLFDEKYAYDYIFFSTEDDKIRDIFVKSFPNKVKQYKQHIKISYSQKDYLGFNRKIKGNIEYNKIYLINIIILSKCLDLITARTNGSAAIFVLTNGFRHVKVYNLGVY